MSIYISLGSSCSVAYQLQKNNLRVAAFPFDWLRTPSLDEIIKVFENNFADFGIFIEDEIKNTCINKFPLSNTEDFPVNFEDNNSSGYLDTKSNNNSSCYLETKLNHNSSSYLETKSTNTQVVKNCYQMTSYHDFSATLSFKEQVHEITDKYQRRVERLLDLIKNSDKRIHFIRDELKPNSLQISDLQRLSEIFCKFPCQAVLTIILHNPKNKNLDNYLSLKLDNITFINDTYKFDGWKRESFNWSIFK
jgi:hypothetical protein